MTGALFQQVPCEPGVSIAACLVQSGGPFTVFDVQRSHMGTSSTNRPVSGIGSMLGELEIPKRNQMQ